MRGALALMETLEDPGPASETLTVELGERSYDIVVGADVLATTGSRLRALLPAPRVVVVTDRTVADLHLDGLRRSLDASAVASEAVVLPPGEATKSFEQLAALADRILAIGIDRKTAIVALGGGVVGDIAGFAAGILLRGLYYVQIPTTLLAQVDSSVGGKTGINTRHGKNLVGLFHQPRLVIADTATLDTLDSRQMRAGYAELVKYGLLGDASFFAWLETSGTAVLEGDRAARRRAVVTACAAKARIVAADEREAGMRALLNLGHTFGHALEVETGFGEALLHGEAVALGMVLAFRLSVRKGVCPPADESRMRAHLAALGLPTRFSDLAPRPWSAERLADHMVRDKKARAGRPVFVLVHGIGRAFLCADVDRDEVVAVFEEAIAG